ncbi:MAG: ATP-dependent DNA ligase [Patescibacteria group bacterium]
MKFSKLAEYLQKLEKTSSRNEITEILAEVFKETTKDEIGKVCYLLVGRIEPQYTGVEFNFAEKMMVRAMAVSYTTDPVQILQDFKRVGDLGDVAEERAREQESKRAGVGFSVVDVYEKLHKMAIEGGKDSQERKLTHIVEMLRNVDSLSAKYIVRIPVGKLRLGFSDITMLDALSLMIAGDKSERKTIEGAYNVLSDIGEIAKRIKKDGLKGLEKVHAVPGVPVRTSLAERLPSAQKIIEKVGPLVAIEPKMDGLRTQLHIVRKGKKREVLIYSRNHENITSMFPEIVEAAKKLPLTDAIFDGEAIGYDPKTQKFALFQQTVQRKRKYEIETKALEIPLKVFVFDVLYLNGKDMISLPFRQRRKVLEDVIGNRADTMKPTGVVMLTRQIVVEKPEQIRAAFEEYSQEGLEGVMAKKIDAPYHAGGRGFHWVKYKKHTEKSGDGVLDTVDCVLMGAYRGKGKRAGFGVGGFLLGLPGKDGKFYTLSNLGTGLSDESFKSMYKMVEKLEVKTQPKDYVVDKLIAPDIWVRPKVVLEILSDEITVSPRHTSAYSLRFPRLIKVREDKNPEDATSISELTRLYKMQRG